MKNYMDFDSDERMNMTREQIESLCSVALMQVGLAMPRPPDPFTEKQPEVSRATRYRLKIGHTELKLLFRSMEDAQKVAALQPTITDTKYLDRTYDTRLEVEDGTGDRITVEAVEIVTEEEYNRTRLALEKWGNAKSTHTEARRHYESARTEIEKTTKDIWADWNELQQLKSRIEEARLTFTKYVDMCSGDKVAARNFLRILIEKDGREKYDVDGFIQNALGNEGLPPPAEPAPAAPAEPAP